LKEHGGSVLKINGAESPEFDHLGDAEVFAKKNFDAVAHPNHATELVQDPATGKWQIYEKEYEPPKWVTIKDASGKDMRIFTDSTGALAAQKQVAETKHYLNVASKSSLELKRDLEAYKEEGTVKGARKELTKVGGDYTKLSPGSKSALLNDAQNQFTKINTLLERIEGKQPELQTPEEQADLAQYKPVRDAYARTIADLTRPSFVPPPGSEAAKAAAAQKPNAPAAVQAPPRPANVPPDYIFVPKGPNGQPGWARPKPVETAPAADEPAVPSA
jgi:hypothetical protein